MAKGPKRTQPVPVSAHLLRLLDAADRETVRNTRRARVEQAMVDRLLVLGVPRTEIFPTAADEVAS